VVNGGSFRKVVRGRGSVNGSAAGRGGGQRDGWQGHGDLRGGVPSSQEPPQPRRVRDEIMKRPIATDESSKERREGRFPRKRRLQWDGEGMR